MNIHQAVKHFSEMQRNRDRDPSRFCFPDHLDTGCEGRHYQESSEEAVWTLLAFAKQHFEADLKELAKDGPESFINSARNAGEMTRRGQLVQAYLTLPDSY